MRTLVAGLIALTALCGNAAAQRVAPDVEKFTEAECRWLHQTLLGECATAKPCGANPSAWEFSMAANRGLTSMENVVTMRSYFAIFGACRKACETKARPAYSEWRNSVCAPLIKP